MRFSVLCVWACVHNVLGDVGVLGGEVFLKHGGQLVGCLVVGFLVRPKCLWDS